METLSQQRTNPLLLFEDHAQTNGSAVNQEEGDGREGDMNEDNCEDYQDLLAHFNLSASEDDDLDYAHQGYNLGKDMGPNETINRTRTNNQKEIQGEIQAGAKETTIVEEIAEVGENDACQQPTMEEPDLMVIHKPDDKEHTATDCTESS
jgi:hypothetical protein